MSLTIGAAIVAICVSTSDPIPRETTESAADPFSLKLELGGIAGQLRTEPVLGATSRIRVGAEADVFQFDAFLGASASSLGLAIPIHFYNLGAVFAFPVSLVRFELELSIQILAAEIPSSDGTLSGFGATPGLGITVDLYDITPLHTLYASFRLTGQAMLRSQDDGPPVLWLTYLSVGYRWVRPTNT